MVVKTPIRLAGGKTAVATLFHPPLEAERWRLAGLVVHVVSKKRVLPEAALDGMRRRLAEHGIAVMEIDSGIPRKKALEAVEAARNAAGVRGLLTRKTAVLGESFGASSALALMQADAANYAIMLNPRAGGNHVIEYNLLRNSKLVIHADKPSGKPGERKLLRGISEPFSQGRCSFIHVQHREGEASRRHWQTTGMAIAEALRSHMQVQRFKDKEFGSWPESADSVLDRHEKDLHDRIRTYRKDRK
ncbi:MAG: hypothetical protein V1787_03050 [Candidatus Micrarchaeota archaeon]